MEFKKANKKNKEKNLNKVEHNKIKTNVNGITLIALVVTIIVLIILAGVSINLIFNEYGIVTRAQNAKEMQEQAQFNEQTALNEAAEEMDRILGKLPTEKPKEKSEVEKYRDAGTYMTQATDVKDSDGNIIKVPKGFKIAEDSGINVTEGIVIEDNDIIEGIGNNRGNQYVWIPVGENIKKSDGTEADITLGRYVFADGTNHKDEEGNRLAKGTPILVQNINDYTNQTDEIKIDTYYYEDITQRDGVESLEGLNATALSISNFKTSVENNKGYYIARYEASYGVDGKANSKVSNNYTSSSGAEYAPTQEGYLWNNITQINAAVASRGLYNQTVATTDLMNSYAWDTAIVYIQKFSNDTDYSYQYGKIINSSLTNTGVNGDEVCKINDMASNTYEWTTEYSTKTNSSGSIAFPCTLRGGDYLYSDHYTSSRYSSRATISEKYSTFRPTLYM